MERLAARMAREMDNLVAAYEGRLQGVGGGKPRTWDARGDLAMVARCLETGDSTPLVAGVCEELAAGTPRGRLLRRLAALELTLIPEVDDMAQEVVGQDIPGAADASKAATFLWNALAQARMALVWPEPGESVTGVQEGWEAFQRQVKVTAYRCDQSEVVPEPQPVAPGQDVARGAETALVLAGADEVRGYSDEVRGYSPEAYLGRPAPDQRSASVAPLSVWGETFGVLGVEVDPENPLSRDDQALLNAVSEQVAQALDSARLFDEEQRARLLLDMRVNELDCLNDIGRQIDQAPPIDELLQWVCTRLPAAMQFPERALVAIELEARLYGVVDPLESPWQMVQNLQVAGVKGKICIAYREPSEFRDEESARLFDEEQRARLLLDMRVNELDCLNDIGRQIDQAPPIDVLLEWVCTRLPAAMQFPERALVAIELEGRVYGVVDALESPWQMVQNLQVAGGKGKICIAYREPSEFLDEESALLG
ncbi:MAG TPA: GAF domain-containing protein, partial [Anaerolineae bacterium]|nr:GAF domain-containing protein [Anaerolineae bacterium]